MDVQLPDGRLLKGVPDGTTKAQLSEKLSSNGIALPKNDDSGGDFLGGSKAWQDFGKDEPNTEYGNILPFKKDLKTGSVMPALPEMIRSPIRGMGDLLESAEYKSTEQTPDSINAMLMITPTSKAVSNAIDNTIYSAPARAAAHALAHPIDTAGKMVAGAVRPVAKSMLESDNPIYGGGLKNDLTSDNAKEGLRLGKKLGVKFSAGELTGNATARAYEDALANSAKWAEKFAQANKKKTDTLIGKYASSLNEIYPKSVSRLDVGDKIASSYKDTLDGLVKARAEQAKSDFNLAAEASAGEPIVAPNHFIQVLKNFIKEGDSPTATPAQIAASKQAKGYLSRLKTDTPKPSVLLDAQGYPIKSIAPAEAYKHITIKDLQNGLSAFGDSAKSNGGIWKGLSTASDRRFAKAAKTALEADMDMVADNKTGGIGALALKNARDNYKLSSQRIDDIKKSTIGKMVGNAEFDSQGNIVLTPEITADKFLKMQPSEIKNTLDFLDKTNPGVAKMARRYTLESVLQKVIEGKGQRGEGSSQPFPKAEFVKSLPDDEKLNAIMGNKKSADDVRDIAAALNRMIDYGASQRGSATAQRTQILEGLLKWGKGAIYRSFATDSLAEDLLDPTRRNDLLRDAKNVHN